MKPEENGNHHSNGTSPNSHGSLSLKTFRPFRKVRRSRSAPAGYGRKKERRLLLEHYYRIDQQNRVLLPGVPSQDPDFARDCHDFFNLIFLVSKLDSELIRLFCIIQQRCILPILIRFK